MRSLNKKVTRATGQNGSFVPNFKVHNVSSNITAEQRAWAEALSASRPELTGIQITRLAGREFNRGFNPSWGSDLVKRVKDRLNKPEDGA